jgi:predicted PurR-regulated permease PerM
MPQLDTLSFFTQMFWFFLAFFILYYLVVNSTIPTISTILKIRNKIKFVKPSDQAISQTNPLDKVISNLFTESKQSEFVVQSKSKGWVDTSLNNVKEANFTTAYNTYLDNLSETLSKNKV